MTRGTAPASRRAEGGGWPRRHRNQLAGFAAAAVVLAGGVLAFMPRQQPVSRPVAADCGLVHCSATLPVLASSGAAASGSGQPGRTPGTGKHASAGGRGSAPASSHPGLPATPGPLPSPVAVVVHTSAPPAPPPPPSRPLTVGYSVVQSRSGFGGTRFVSRFTLVNHTGSAVTGWALQAGLPHAWVQWVSPSPGGYPWYRDWSPVRDGIVISGARGSEAIPAHGTLVLYFSAEGSGTGLSSCTINGASC